MGENGEQVYEQQEAEFEDWVKERENEKFGTGLVLGFLVATLVVGWIFFALGWWLSP